MEPVKKQIGWYNASNKRFCYIDDYMTNPVKYVSYRIPVFIEEDLIEFFVKTYGEKYRQLITTSFTWLEENEPGWNLEKPIDKTLFIKNLIESAQ